MCPSVIEYTGTIFAGYVLIFVFIKDDIVAGDNGILHLSPSGV
jgi:hypothetical protein